MGTCKRAVHDHSPISRGRRLAGVIAGLSCLGLAGILRGDDINTATPGSDIVLTPADPANPNRQLNVTPQNNVDTLELQGTTLTLPSGRTLNLQDGLLRANSGTSAISSGGILTAGGAVPGTLAIEVAGGSQLTISSPIADNGSGAVGLQLDGSGILILNQSNSFTGNILINSGTLRFNNNNRLGGASGDVTLAGGTLQLVSSNVTLGAGRTLNLATGTSSTLQTDRNLTLNSAGQFAGDASTTLTKTGTSTLTISQANSGFSGSLVVQAGILDLRSANALGSGVTKGDVTLNGTRMYVRSNSSANFGNDVSTSGNAVIYVERIASGTNLTHSLDDVSVNGGELEVNGRSGFILAIDGLALSSTPNLDTVRRLDVGGVVSGSGFTKSGGQELRLQGAEANTYTGAVTVQVGRMVLDKTDGVVAITGGLVIGDADATAEYVLLQSDEQIADTAAVTLDRGGRLEVNGRTETIGSLGNAGTTTDATQRTVTLGSGTLRTGGNDASTTFTGIISGTGNLVKQGSGVFTLKGTNTYSGQTIIEGGTLLLGGNNFIANSSAVELAGGTLGTGGFSDVMNSLSLSANSTIDLGAGASVLTFTNGAGTFTPGRTLSILNWTGNEAGGGTDRLIFGSSLSPAQLAQITFVDPIGFGPGVYGAQQLVGGEVVPVPEPAVIFSAAGILALAVGHELLRRWKGRRGAARISA